MSRGKKKPLLRDLSRELLAEDEFDTFLKEFIEGTDRSAALLGCAQVDAALFRALTTKMVFHNGEDDVERLFFNSDAPLSSLSARTRLAVALGIFLPEIGKIIDSIRHIRNAFAHTVKPIPFDHPLVNAELDKLPSMDGSKIGISRERIKASGLDDTSLSEQRLKYANTTSTLTLVLERYAALSAGAQIAVPFSNWEQMLSWLEKSERPHPPRLHSQG